jgi:HSP20 family protein
MRLVRYTNPFRTSAQNDFARSPWAGLEGEIDRLFETALTDFGGTSGSGRFPIDLYEDKDNTYVRAELPGFNRDDINVEMVEGFLTISATRKDQGSGDGNGDTFSLSRSVTINEAVQADKVSANYENGVLTVLLPKREEAKPKKVTVAVK